MQKNIQRRLAATAVAGVLIASGCDNPFALLFDFDRSLPATTGAIFGDLVRDATGGQGVGYAQINLMGTGLVRQANSEGLLALTDLGAGTYVLRISDDEDGDGQPERSHLIAATLAIADRPDAIGFGSGPQLVSTSLGEVIVSGTGSLSGQARVDDGTGTLVPPDDVNLVGRALLFRNITTDTTGDQALALGADAETHVDATGRYTFIDALAGEVQVVVTFHEAAAGGGNSIRGKTVFVSEPQTVTIVAADSVTADDVDAPGFDVGLEDTVRDVEVVITPTFHERATPYAIFVPPGKAVSACQATRPATTQFAYERIIDATVAGISRLNGAPVGVWDVRLCGETQFLDPQTGTLADEIRVGGAQLFSLVVPPAPDGVSTVLTGPVVLQQQLDPCLRSVCPDGGFECEPSTRVTIRDCDGDGRPGLPLFDVSLPEVRTAWSTCAVLCGVAVGVDAAEAVCTIDANAFDCDDDGDLQTDASEPPACYGPGLGDDRDGDGVCSGEDAFPTCAANTADACVAGTVDVSPVIPPDFEGGVDPSLNPFDVTYEDNGTLKSSALGTVLEVVGTDFRAARRRVFVSKRVDLEVEVLAMVELGGAATDLLLPTVPRAPLSFKNSIVNNDTYIWSGFEVPADAENAFVSRLVGQPPIQDIAFGNQGFTRDDVSERTRWGAVAEIEAGGVVAAGVLEEAGTISLRMQEFDNAGVGQAPVLFNMDTALTAFGGVLTDLEVTAIVTRAVDPDTRVLIVGNFINDLDTASFFATAVLGNPGAEQLFFRTLSTEAATRYVSDRTTAVVEDPASGLVTLLGTHVLEGGTESVFWWSIDIAAQDLPQQAFNAVAIGGTGAARIEIFDGAITGGDTLIVGADFTAVDGDSRAMLWTLSPGDGAPLLRQTHALGNFGNLSGTRSKAIKVDKDVAGDFFVTGEFGAPGEVTPLTTGIWNGKIAPGLLPAGEG